MCAFLFFFNDTATTEIYTLSLHDALPISAGSHRGAALAVAHPGPSAARATRCRDPAHRSGATGGAQDRGPGSRDDRSEEHTSELQSHLNIVCRLLLEKIKASHPHVSLTHP